MFYRYILEQLRKLNGKKEGVDDDFVPSKFKVSRLTSHILCITWIFQGLTVATAMVNLDDESEFELVEKPDVTSNQERFKLFTILLILKLIYSLLQMLAVQLDSCLAFPLQLFWLSSISLSQNYFFCCIPFSLYYFDSSNVSAMEMVSYQLINMQYQNDLGLRNRGVQKDLEDDKFIKNKLNNHFNNHNDYINWEASPYKQALFSIVYWWYSLVFRMCTFLTCI